MGERTTHPDSANIIWGLFTKLGPEFVIHVSQRVFGRASY